MREAVAAGWRALAEGGTALDAVEAAVRSLEDHPRFNAGRGSVLTPRAPSRPTPRSWKATSSATARWPRVAGVRNPITLARRILEAGRHSLFAAAGPLARAGELGVPLCDPGELVTEQQRRRLAALQAGTVGAVALDRFGTIAAATSTGGSRASCPGRVGDSALIGCGTYAESTLGGVSCTGDGEAIIRVTLARRTLEILKTVGDPGAGLRGRHERARRGRARPGRLILVDWRGRVGWARSTPLMPVGLMSPAHGEPELPF